MPDQTAPNGHDRAVNRAAINKANAQHSTGPRTAAGKQRSSLNAWRHGLTGQTVVLPTEDHSAYERHSQSFLDEYHPQGATETQLASPSSILPGGSTAPPPSKPISSRSASRKWKTAFAPTIRRPKLPSPWLWHFANTCGPSPASAPRASASPVSSNAPSRCFARSRPNAAHPKSASSTRRPRF